MKLQLLLPATILASVGLLVLIKLRAKEHEKEDKRHMFQDIKLRVTSDVLQEYQADKLQMHSQLEKLTSDTKTLEEDVKTAQMASEKAKVQAEGCAGEEKTARDELATVETQYNDLKASTDKENSTWNTELEALQKQLAAKSPVCNFLKSESQISSKLCDDVREDTSKQEKAEDPKKDGPEAEAAKEGEAKAEAPKEGEAKAEAPKEGEAKAEAPKEGEAKAEAPKEGEAKAEAPKEGEAKAEAPKEGEAKAEAPKEGEAKAEAPKEGEAKAEAPKEGEAKEEAPKKE